MACFTLTAKGREALLAALTVGLEGAHDWIEGDHDEETIAALFDELGAGTGAIEITVMPIEGEG